MTRAIVLGGGVAGLAAAYRLLQLRPDWQVTVFEEEERVGGLAACWKVEGFSADLGPHRIYTELPEIEALLPELVEQDQMLTVARRSELLLRGHFYRYPVRAGELLRQMGVVTMVRLGLSAVAGKVAGFLKGRTSNYEDWMVASFGRGVYRLIIEPYTRKVWKIEPAQLSSEVARVRVSAGNVNRLVQQLLGRTGGRKGTQSALSSFSYLRGGVEGLVRSLEQKVIKAGGEIVTSRRVCGFRGSEGGLHQVEICMADAGGLPVAESADFIISTVPVTNLVRMLQPVKADEAARKTADELVYIGLILVGVVVRRPRFTANSWIYFPEEQFVFNRSYEPKNFDPSMAPEDRSLAVFEVTARWDSDLWKSPDGEIIERVKSDAVKSGLLQKEEIETAFAVRIPYTYPLYSTGYHQKLDTVFGYLGQFSNLVSTGRQGLFNHNNMDHSMLMGIRAAECVAEGEKPAQRWYAGLEQFAGFRIVD